MSNFLAVATVTETLRQMLNSAVSRDVSGGARATAVRPAASDKSSMSGLPEVGVNIFLYQIGFNAERRNSDLPNRRADGSLMQRPKVALDLHYLLTFYGDEKQLEPQRLLGSAVSALHSRPALSRPQIQMALQANDFLEGSDLAEELEMVKFTPLPLSIEEMHNLWSGFFQSPYVLSIAYQASVLFIEGRETPQESLPVQRVSISAGTFREPFIERVALPDDAGRMQPIVQDCSLLVRGRNLLGQSTRVRVGKSEITPLEADEDCLKISLSEPPFPRGSLRAGINSLQVIHDLLLGEPPAPHRGFESNAVAFMLRPTISSVSITASSPAGEAGISGELNLNVRPEIGRGQRAVLFLNELPAGSPKRGGAGKRDSGGDKSSGIISSVREAKAYIFRAEISTEDSDKISFAFQNIKAGAYSVRLQVDGAESPLYLDQDEGSPTLGLYARPKVEIAGRTGGKVI